MRTTFQRRRHPSVMGSPTEAFFLGSKVKGIMGFVPLPGKLGLGCTITSYNGNIKLGFCADPAALEDPALFKRYVISPVTDWFYHSRIHSPTQPFIHAQSFGRGVRLDAEGNFGEGC